MMAGKLQFESRFSNRHSQASSIVTPGPQAFRTTPNRHSDLSESEEVGYGIRSIPIEACPITKLNESSPKKWMRPALLAKHCKLRLSQRLSAAFAIPQPRIIVRHQPAG